jgi:hypothetical protein
MLLRRVINTLPVSSRPLFLPLLRWRWQPVATCAPKPPPSVRRQAVARSNPSFQRRQVEIGERHVCTTRHRIAHRRIGLSERVDLPKRVCHRAIHARGEGRLRRESAAAGPSCANALGRGVQAAACHAHTFWRREIEVTGPARINRVKPCPP